MTLGKKLMIRTADSKSPIRLTAKSIRLAGKGWRWMNISGRVKASLPLFRSMNVIEITC